MDPTQFRIRIFWANGLNVRQVSRCITTITHDEWWRCLWNGGWNWSEASQRMSPQYHTCVVATFLWRVPQFPRLETCKWDGHGKSEHNAASPVKRLKRNSIVNSWSDVLAKLNSCNQNMAMVLFRFLLSYIWTCLITYFILQLTPVLHVLQDLTSIRN